MCSISKAADLNYLVQGGQLYRAFPFSKGSLAIHFELDVLTHKMAVPVFYFNFYRQLVIIIVSCLRNYPPLFTIGIKDNKPLLILNRSFQKILIFDQRWAKYFGKFSNSLF